MKAKSITKVLKVCDKTKEQMIEFFEYSKREKTPPYAIFQAIDGDTVVTLYESGKVVFQGKDADLASDYWIETEKINSGNNALIEKKEKEKKDDEKTLPIRINSIGSDEVGTGDYFGPIVVTSAYVSKENIDFLIDLKVKDSKKLTDEQIVKIVPEIIKKIPYHTLILTNKQYNEYYSDDMNLNKIKAILHNKVLYELVKDNKYSYDYIVVDQFEYPKSYYNHIRENKNQIKNIFFMTKAEDKCLSVACASMISRYIFLQEMNKLSKELNIILPKGASNLVDEVAKKIVDTYGFDKLESIAKLNFKNTEKLKKM